MPWTSAYSIPRYCILSELPGAGLRSQHYAPQKTAPAQAAAKFRDEVRDAARRRLHLSRLWLEESSSLGNGGIFGRGSGDSGLVATSRFREIARPREPIAIKLAPPIISQCGNSIDESMPIYFFALGSSVVSCRSGQSYNRPLTRALHAREARPAPVMPTARHRWVRPVPDLR
jgi:hypothetical protein